MKLNEGFNLNDDIKINSSNLGLKGHVVFRDPLTNEIVYEKDNLILLRSRVYILELLSGLVADKSLGYINNKKSEDMERVRRLCLFKVGSGGADIENSPFESIAPQYDDKDLYSPFPFVIQDYNKDLDPTKAVNPSYIEELDSEDKYRYYLPYEDADGSVKYYGKSFESQNSKLIVSEASGEAYLLYTLEIDISECRGNIFNELGLMIGYYNTESNSYEDVELFSHITFESDALKSLKKGLIIEYFIYA